MGKYDIITDYKIIEATPAALRGLQRELSLLCKCLVDG